MELTSGRCRTGTPGLTNRWIAPISRYNATFGYNVRGTLPIPAPLIREAGAAEITALGTRPPVYRLIAGPQTASRARAPALRNECGRLAADRHRQPGFGHLPDIAQHSGAFLSGPGHRND